MANLKSQSMCENLIYSIRTSGCTLPIRLIHFGGKPINSKYIFSQVEYLTYDDFSSNAKAFITNLRTVLTDCPLGYLYRFLVFFSDWDEVLYSDNDIVALSNWENMFAYLEENDVVHADEEYTTQGAFNYNKPEKINQIFGKYSLDSALTAGHFIARVQPMFIADMNKAVEWFKQNSDIPKKHDQALLHIASLLGNWRMLNLCKSPHNWLSSWSGDYKNTLDLIQAIQGCSIQQTVSYSNCSKIRGDDLQKIERESDITKFSTISHIHYSGGSPRGNAAIEDLLYSNITNKARINLLVKVGLQDLFCISLMKTLTQRVNGFIKRKLS